MATASQRRYRQKAHDAFDVLWKDGLMDRDSAYLWMGELLGLSYDQAHIGLLTREQLEQLIAAVPGHYRTVVRRKAKQNAKRIERVSREQQAANRGGRR
jgi:hypothetical protein